jgi:uncharacterized RDD family membrane protein YckC
MNEALEFIAPPDPLAGRYAGFWRKVAAPLIDFMVFLPFYMGIKILCGEHHVLLAEIIFTVFVLVAYGVFFVSKWQATLGMRLLNFYVCDQEGNSLSYAKALTWGVVSLIGMAICFSGFMYMQYRFDLMAVLQLLTSCKEENMRMEDCWLEMGNLIDVPYETFSMMMVSASVLALFLLLIWALSVALARDKSGFHNLICHTRFIMGRL